MILTKRTLLYFVLALFLLESCDQRPAPTKEQLKTLRDSAKVIVPRFRRNTPEAERQTKLQEAEKRMAAFLKGEDGKYNIHKLSYGQLKDIPQDRLQVYVQWVSPVLQELSTTKHDSAVVAGFLYLSLQDQVPYEAYRKLFNGSEKLLLKDGNWGPGLVNLMTRVEMNDQQRTELLNMLNAYIDINLLHENVLKTFVHGIWPKVILPVEKQLPTETVKTFRAKVATAYEQLLAKGEVKNPQFFENDYAHFKTLYAQGKLIGSEAPAIHFLWNSTREKWKTLADLKGKVVVMDLWATWCGPCVRAFPNVRKLQERYKGYPVVVLGMTSLQGEHYDRLNKKRTDCSGNPQKEFSLMKQFIKDMEITWPVVFGKEDVFNIEYGVEGIPHIVIIDAEGRVRYNKLHPANPPYHEAEKIDALLKEAGLKYPKEPMEKVNYVKE